jgi:hypothetical protein
MSVKMLEDTVIFIVLGVICIALGAIIPAKPTTSTAILFIIGVIFIFSAITTRHIEDRLGKSLTFDMLRKGRIRVFAVHNNHFITVGTLNNENLRHLTVVDKMGFAIYKPGMIIEITGFKKKHFKDLDKRMFFLDGNTVLHIVTAEELAHEESLLKRHSTRDHSWNS